MKKTIFSLCVAAAAFAAEAKTIGIWKDPRIGDLSGPLNTLTNSGWQVKWLYEATVKGKHRNLLADPKELAECDVVYFPGGWGRYFFPPYSARKAVVKYVASGGGALVTAFRGGYTRTANRPMFPDIAEVCNRLSSAWIFPYGESAIAKSFGGKALAGGSGDHLTLKVGPKGTVFAENSGDPVGAFGDYGCGRVIVYGGHFSYSTGEDTRPDNDRILMAMLSYLTGAKKPSSLDAAMAAEAAEREFIRRERMWDLTLDERGPDRTGGVIPVARDRATAVPEAIAHKLDYFANFLSGKDAEKCRAEAARLHAKVKEVCDESAKMKKAAEKALSKMDNAALNAFKVDASEWSKTNVAEKFAAMIDTNSIPAVAAYVESLAPAVRAAKAAALEKELAEDMKSVPALIEKTASKSAKERIAAAVELGRIAPDGEKPLKALVGLLGDADDRVRTQAAISLGWMQAKGAVDALVAMASSKCVWDRRRAVQALGQIGDRRAVPALMKALDDSDWHVKQLAALSLGYVKAPEARERLLAIARGKDNVNMRECAILALGSIGDKRDVEALEAIRAESGDDRPRTGGRGSKTGNPPGNPFSFGSHAMTRSSFGVWWTVKFALDDIARGGRPEPGVRQLKARRSKKVFYAITGNCSSLAGRFDRGLSAFDRRNRKYILPHLKEAGFTGVHTAWGVPGWSESAYVEMLREADDLDMTWVDTIPGYAGAGKPETAYRFDRLSEFACLSGFWAEETWPEIGIDSYSAYLKNRFGDDWRTKCGLNEAELKELDDRIAAGGWQAFAAIAQDDKKKEENFAPPWNGRLRSLVLEADGDTLADYWRESQDFLHGARMGFAQTYVVSTADPVRYPNDDKIMAQIDSIGLESYQSFGRSSSYFMQRYRDGEGRSSMSELYNWYCPSPEHALRGFWQNAIHSKCFFNFALYHIFKHTSGEYLWVWDNGRWDAFREVYRRVAANDEFYRIVPSAANAAVLFSARTQSLTRDNDYAPCGVPQRNDQNAMAAWVALGQRHIPADVVYADQVEPEKLAKYDVLYLPDSKFLGPKGIESIREWVKAGGVLVAEGGSTLFDGETLALKDNYGLADVFGVRYEGTDFLPDDKSDTFCRRRGLSASAFKFVGDLSQRYHLEDSIHRDIKPSKGVVTMKFGKDAPGVLPGIKAGDEMEIDAALGIDRVKPTTAREVAAFADGRGAMFVNEFGKGRCYFFSSQYPLMGHVTSEWEMMPNKFDFWQNVAETLEAAVRGGFAMKGATCAVEVSGFGPDIEVTVDDQGSRLVVHMLDYNVRNKTVKGGTLTIPGERAVKRVWYPDTKTELKLDGRTAKLRDFSAYDMLAVEFE